jgi:hypothetical protein
MLAPNLINDFAPAQCAKGLRTGTDTSFE